jgi:uncharacterized protein involved in exopolysaccharide biosynthesis/Mrp family chromosome partitioning ATPase
MESNSTIDVSVNSTPVGMSLSDIYFILFRRKWIILLCAVLGIAAAGGLYVYKKPLYESDSKLLVRYVVERRSPIPLGDNSQIRAPDSGDAGIINSEIEILRSLDLFAQVAEAVGPAKILKSLGGGDDKFLAAAMIARGTVVDVPPRSTIIKVTFRHRDPEVIKPVLDALMKEYLRRHGEIHQGLGSLDIVLSQESDQLRSRLNDTEEELRKLKTKAGVISIDETKTSYIQEISNLRRELFNSEAALAEARAAVASTPTNSASSTGAVSVARGAVPDPEIPGDILNQYREAMARRAELRNREFSLVSQNYGDQNPLLKHAREQLAEIEQQRKDLESRYPNLLKVPVSPQAGAGAPELSLLATERARVVALEAKVDALKKQLEEVRGEVAKLDEYETPLKQLQRKRDLEETNFRHFSGSLERARFDETLSSGRNSNISVVQTPSPPRRDDTKRLKMVGAVAGGGVAAGLALAFLLELFLDQSIRRPQEVPGRLQMPLFMGIPYVNGKAMRLLGRKKKKHLGNGNAEEPSVQPATAWEVNHPLRPVFEGLRDRMALHFKNTTHKPKLVGISTCSDNAGATTIAAGLAAALSETGEGKVLLVDMHQPNGVAHPFAQGKHVCELGDILEEDKRAAGMVQENLYLALVKDNPNPRMGLLAKQLSNLVPKFKASDYDYIIFDMPRVSSTSPSVRLAGMMDLVLLVVESEKVSRQAVKQAHSLLHATGVDTRIILNKVRSYVPSMLSGEL